MRQDKIAYWEIVDTNRQETVMRKPFGNLPDGREVEHVVLENYGMRAAIITRGATLQDLRVEGHDNSLVLGFDRLDHYLQHPRYFGANVGRFANRLGGGRALIGGQNYDLDRNERGIQTLHGGSDGSGVRLWNIEKVGADRLTLSDHLAHGHMGFPGNLEVSIDYQIVAGPTLEIRFRATCDQTTLCNFAHHSYFNLDGSDTILDHQLQIDADQYLVVDDNLIPTGSPQPVENTAFDFRDTRALSWLGKPYFYDHNFCLSDQRQTMRPVAKLHSPLSGVTMTIATTEPGLQMYDGAKIQTPQPNNLTKQYKAHGGIALEPQCWPDAPNQNGFPSAELASGDIYEQVTQFRFD